MAPPAKGGSNAESVHVVVRVRPLSEKEKKESRKNALDVEVQRGQVQVFAAAQGNSKPPAFTFDKVYSTDSKQHEVFDQTALPIVKSCLEGYNGTIFAYGQTGAGKSFTMEGKDVPADAKGVIPRTFDHIFSKIKQDDSKDYLVRASYLELYNEDILDLLSKNPNAKLELKENPDKGVYVKDLSQVVCDSREQISGLLEAGRKNRSTGATQMNQDSSRSHSIFQITVETAEKLDAKAAAAAAAAKPGKKDEESHIRVGKLNLVDLAGSERQSKTGATGDRLKEGIKINLSLASLGNVISALVDGKATHVPYRDSKLTRLLQDSLGGNTKTVMIANVGPADYNCEETMSTLRYANRAKNIQNKPRINEDPKDTMLREYQDEIKRLRALLAAKGEQPLDGEKGRQQLEAARAEGRAEAERVQKEQEAARAESDAKQMEVARREGRAVAEQLQKQQEAGRKAGEAQLLEAARKEGRAEAEQLQKLQEGARKADEAQKESARRAAEAQQLEAAKKQGKAEAEKVVQQQEVVRAEREAQQLAAARREGKAEAEKVAQQQEMARAEREAQQLAAARREGKTEAEKVAQQQEVARAEREVQQLAAARREGKTEAEKVAQQQEVARAEREAQQLVAARREGKADAKKVAAQQEVARADRETQQLAAARKEGKAEAEAMAQQQEVARAERETQQLAAAKKEGKAEAEKAAQQQEAAKKEGVARVEQVGREQQARHEADAQQQQQKPGHDLPQHPLPGEDMLAFLERKCDLLPHELQELRRLQQERERLKQEKRRMDQELQRLHVTA